MATVCDYCGEAISDDGRVNLVPTPDPVTGKAGPSLDFHLECQRAFLADAAITLRGKGQRPNIGRSNG